MNKVPKIPEKEEVSQLARWARVAFAARCAKRVQPILERTWPDVSPEDIAVIKKAILSTEDAATNARALVDLEKERMDVGKIEEVFRSYIGKQKGAAVAYFNNHVNHPAFYSLHAAYCAVCATQEKNNTDRAWEACYCCEKMDDFTYDPAYRDELVRHIRWDFGKLQQSRWDDNTPIKPDVLGQLWDEGKEPDWDEIAKGMKRKMENTG